MIEAERKALKECETQQHVDGNGQAGRKGEKVGWRLRGRNAS